MPRFLTLADISDQLNITPATARSLVTSGELPGIQVGPRKMWRVEETAFEDYITRLYKQNEQRLHEETLENDRL